MFGRKSEAQKWAEVKLDPTRNAKAARGLTPAETVTRQAKVEKTRGKRR